MDGLPIIDTDGTARNIKALRCQKGMTVRDVQDVFCFTTPQAIYKWERGTALPTVDNLVILAKIFDRSIDQILILRS